VCVCVCVYKWVYVQTSATFSTVASFIENAIHHGKPPVITSLLGGTVRQIIPILFLLIDIIFKIVTVGRRMAVVLARLTTESRQYRLIASYWQIEQSTSPTAQLFCFTVSLRRSPRNLQDDGVQGGQKNLQDGPLEKVLLS